jgi:hypothetical protein
MRIPVLRGIIDRRILVNYRVDPEVLEKLLPPPFRPKLINGAGMAGICLIRLKQIRPRFLPPLLGLCSENAAHRIAVEWDQGEGVFVPRRDTSSRINATVGGKLFPGMHYLARFQIQERDDHYRVCLDSNDHQTHLLVEGSIAPELPTGSVFGSLGAASTFFERGTLGYSATTRPGEFDGLELRSIGWRVEPLAVERVESSFFDDSSLFPAGSAEFDCALLMRGIEHEWHGREPLRGVQAGVVGAASDRRCMSRTLPVLRRDISWIASAPTGRSCGHDDRKSDPLP